MSNKIEIGMIAIRHNRINLGEVVEKKGHIKIRRRNTEGVINPQIYDFFDDILDVIEPEDYVNGYQVLKVDKKNRTVLCKMCIIKENEIETILTKEMLEYDAFYLKGEKEW